MDSLVSYRPIQPMELEVLKENAAADGHGVWFPTHVAVKDDEIVGYLSIGHVPVILTWQHTKKFTAIDSVKAIGFVEGALCNAPAICFPCDPESPYMRFLPKAGYKMYSKPVHLFIKEGGH